MITIIATINRHFLEAEKRFNAKRTGWHSDARDMESLTDLRVKVQAMFDALVEAESFIAGFEDDEMQEGVDHMLGEIRAAIANAKGGGAP